MLWATWVCGGWNICRKKCLQWMKNCSLKYSNAFPCFASLALVCSHVAYTTVLIYHIHKLIRHISKSSTTELQMQCTCICTWRIHLCFRQRAMSNGVENGHGRWVSMWRRNACIKKRHTLQNHIYRFKSRGWPPRTYMYTCIYTCIYSIYILVTKFTKYLTRGIGIRT